MKSENLLLAAAVLVVGTGLVLFARHGGAPATPDDDQRGRDPSVGAATAQRASEEPDVVEALTDAVAEWTVAVRGPEGKAVDDAFVIIRGPGEERRGEGPACVFEDISAGVWTVEVRAEGYFHGQKRVPLKAAAAVETVVALATTRSMAVEVIDTRGEPVERERVWLLPEGTGHPDDPARRFEMVNAMTSAGGRCSLPIVAGRTYRLSLGAADEGPRALSETFVAAEGMEGNARWTVLALARLTVIVDELEEEETVLVTAWTDSEREIQPPDAAPIGGVPDSALASTSGAKPTERATEQEGSSGDGGADSSRPTPAPDAAAQAHMEAERARVAAQGAEVGDQLFRLRVQSGREATREGFPVEQRVRFRLQRGAETFAVPTSFSARPGDDARLRLVAREPFPVGAQMPVELRTVPATVERIPSEPGAPRPGLVTR